MVTLVCHKPSHSCKTSNSATTWKSLPEQCSWHRSNYLFKYVYLTRVTLLTRLNYTFGPLIFTNLQFWPVNFHSSTFGPFYKRLPPTDFVQVNAHVDWLAVQVTHMTHQHVIWVIVHVWVDFWRGMCHCPRGCWLCQNQWGSVFCKMDQVWVPKSHVCNS
jgi:hypothetical protein